MSLKYMPAILSLYAIVPCAYAAGIPTFSLVLGDITAAAVKMNNNKQATMHTSLEVTLMPSKQR